MKKIIKTISILLIFALCVAFSGCTPKVELSSISFNGAKLEFAFNEEFSIGDLVVKAQYSDGSEEEITSYSIDSSAYDKTIAGSYEILLSYEDKQTSYNVTVGEPQLSSITVSGSKTEFDYNEEFSVGSLVVKAIYEDGSEIEVTDYSLDSSAYVKNVADVYLILVNYNEISASYEVVVKAPPVRSITVSGAKTEFEWNENFSVGNLVVKARYADNNRVEVEDYEVDFSTFDKTISGAYTITVSYQGKSATYLVVVKIAPISEVEVVSYKQEYTIYQNFKFSDVSGYLVRANGDKEEISSLNTAFELVDYEDFRLGEFHVKLISKENENVTHELTCETIKATSLKVLMIGNSFSDDTSQYVPNILQELGYEFEIGNMYIGGCSISTHYSKLTSNSASYDFRYYTNGAWNDTYGGVKQTLAYAIKFKDWDVITFQQASGHSGISSTYSDLDSLVAGVLAKATNPNVKVAFNMTWAYQGNSTHSDFAKYSNNQQTMYNAILSTMQEKVDMPIIPNGTAIQNARSSYVGDTLTRDGYHLTYDLGRYIAGLTIVARLTHEDISEVEFKPENVTEQEHIIAIESVKNALEKPFEVTKSQYEQAGINFANLVELEYEEYGWTETTGYWNSTTSTYNVCITPEINSSDVNVKKFVATKRFTKEELPVGSVIKIESGWQYRPEAWITDAKQSSRPNGVSTTYVVVTEEWWANYTLRAFNVGNGTNIYSTHEDAKTKFTIYLPKN